MANVCRPNHQCAQSWDRVHVDASPLELGGEKRLFERRVVGDYRRAAHPSEQFWRDLGEGWRALDLGVRNAVDEGGADIPAIRVDQCRELVLDLAAGVNARDRHFDNPIEAGGQPGRFEVDHRVGTAVLDSTAHGSAPVLEERTFQSRLRKRNLSPLGVPPLR